MVESLILTTKGTIKGTVMKDSIIAFVDEDNEKSYLMNVECDTGAMQAKLVQASSEVESDSPGTLPVFDFNQRSS